MERWRGKGHQDLGGGVRREKRGERRKEKVSRGCRSPGPVRLMFFVVEDVIGKMML